MGRPECALAEAVSLQQALHSIPAHRGTRRPAVQPPLPHTAYLFAESRDRTEVTNDTVVTEVTTKLATQSAPLRFERVVPVGATPLRDARQRVSEAALGRLAFDDPLTRASDAPEVREAEQIEGSACCMPTRPVPIRAAEFH